MKMIITLSKGQQITIPAKYRKELNLDAGSRVEMIKKGNKIIIQSIEENLPRLFAEARKTKPKHKLSAKQMDALVEDEVLR